MNSATSSFLTLIAVLSLVSIGSLLHGQTAVTGGITGYVADASGAAVSGADVEAKSTDTEVAEHTATNSSGVYQIRRSDPWNLHDHHQEAGVRGIQKGSGPNRCGNGSSHRRRLGRRYCNQQRGGYRPGSDSPDRQRGSQSDNRR